MSYSDDDGGNDLIDYNEQEDTFDEIADDAAQAAGEEAGIQPEQTTVIRPDRSRPVDNLENHPKIRRILQDPNVSEVRIRYKIKGNRRMQPYVCIIYLDGSSIERPLADIDNDEAPVCPPRQRIITTSPESYPRRGRWGWGGLRRRCGFGGDDGDVKRFVQESRTRDGNCTIVKRKSMIVMCDDSEETRGQRWSGGRGGRGRGRYREWDDPGDRGRGGRRNRGDDNYHYSYEC